MFLAAAKLSMVEALRSVFTEDFEEPRPRRVDIEYPLEEDSWPAIFVQFRPGNQISWTGLNPDEYQRDGFNYKRYRQGRFEGSYDLTILALTSGERDAIWDSVIDMVLMGEENSKYSQFHQTINQHDMIDLTILASQISPIGDSVGVGTPWDGEQLSYEASLKIQAIGEFFFDTQEAVYAPVSDIKVFPNIQDVEPIYGENDSQGEWNKYD